MVLLCFVKLMSTAVIWDWKKYCTPTPQLFAKTSLLPAVQCCSRIIAMTKQQVIMNASNMYYASMRVLTHMYKSRYTLT